MNSHRQGIVLVATLLLILALALLSAGLVFAATESIRTARARETAARTRLIAESAAAAILGEWRTSQQSSLPLRSWRTVETHPGSATIQQLGQGMYFLTGSGDTLPGSRRPRTGVLVRTLTLRDLWLPFQAALSAGGSVDLRAGARIDASQAVAAPAGWTSLECPPVAADSFLAIFPAQALPGIIVPDAISVERQNASILGAPPLLEDSLLRSATFQGIGPVGPPILHQIADRIEAGTVTPAPQPSDDGSCDASAPANWGAPLDPASACGAFFPLIYAPGDLTVTGGAGQGVLVVQGNLDITGPLRFYGAVIVGGTLRLAPGAAIYGAARTGSHERPSAISQALISYCACSLYRALSNAPALQRAFRAGGRAWLPYF